MKRIIFILIISSVYFSLKSEIKISSVLRSNMVLQRNTDVNIWGSANPNEKLTITTSWNKTKVFVQADNSGKWETKVKTTEAGGPYNIVVKAAKDKVLLENILLGEVWVCSGQSNMEMPVEGYAYQPVIGSNEALMHAQNSNIRLFTIKKAPSTVPLDTCIGSWREANAESVRKFSAVGYFYAKILQQQLGVPIGMICSSYGGSRIEAWMSPEALAKFPVPLKSSSQASTEQNRPSRLFNGMIYPILNYTFKGVIWYQGESNRVNHPYYADLLTSMVFDWRTGFKNGDFPFYYVQIAPFSYGKSDELSSAFLREQQMKALSMIPNAGMVTTIDIGTEQWNHPPEKQKVAERLSYWAMAETYNMKGLDYKSPVFKSIKVKDSIVIIAFENADLGITSYNKSVDCFEIAGADSVFYPAKMTLLNSDLRNVQIHSSVVKNPVAIRYGFRNFPRTEGYLFGITGLPVSSFRSDYW
ncbi:MAG: sialate O-acetylesterase [Paludibacter sp.]|nr:sialate O-acetylesterase [Paludibacter sp.]